MAEKTEKKPEAPASKEKEATGKKPETPAAPKAAGGSFLAKTPVLLGVVMVVEAGILFAGFKMLGGGTPKAAAAAELTTEESQESHGSSNASEGHGEKTTKKTDKKKVAIINVVEGRFPNKATGRTYLYDIQVAVMTKGEFEERVTQIVKDRDAMIKDRLRTVIAQIDPEKLGGSSEPGLETLKRQVKYQLDDIMGEGLIDEVLISRCLPFRADF